MTRSRLLFGVAAVLAGSAMALVVLGIAYAPLLVLAAIPFGLAAGVLWIHATGRLHATMRAGVHREAMGGGSGRRGSVGWPGAGKTGHTGRAGSASRSRTPDDGEAAAERSGGMSRTAAARLLGVPVDAEPDTVRSAFRERVREAHPDAPEGDAETFRRLQRAYDALESRR